MIKEVIVKSIVYLVGFFVVMLPPNTDNDLVEKPTTLILEGNIINVI